MLMFAILILSLLLALVAYFVPRGGIRAYAMGSSALVLLLILVYSVLRFAHHYTGGQLSVTTFALAPSIGIYFTIGVNGFTDALLILSAIIIFFSVLITDPRKFDRTMYALILTTEVGLIGLLISRNFLFFYIFWEVVLVPVFFIILRYGGGRGMTRYRSSSSSTPT